MGVGVEKQIIFEFLVVDSERNSKKNSYSGVDFIRFRESCNFHIGYRYGLW